MSLEVPVLGVSQITNDKEYIEEYFKVCTLIRKKRIAMVELAVPLPNGDLYKTIKTLNVKIKDMDRMFWERVGPPNPRKRLTIETLFVRNSFDLYEKRIFLFFLYLEFCHIAENICGAQELLELFDWGGSLINRIRHLKYYSDESPLVKKTFLVKSYRSNETSAKSEFSLTSKALDAVGLILNGKKTPFIVGESQDKELRMLCQEVGSFKDPAYSMDDVMLKKEVKEKVLFMLESVKENKFEELGILEKGKRGNGLIFLFYGPPGTGKSMLAEAVASYLRKKLLMVEMPKIMAKYIGETDKNISQVFQVAREGRSVVCIDEADSIVHSRRFADSDHEIRFVNIALQELEKFEGVAVLTTNMETLLDPALERRVALKVKFEIPDEQIRQVIWKSHIPQSVKLNENVDFGILANKYNFSGGYIKNAVHKALRRYALNKQKFLTMDDLLFGADLEKDGMINNDVLKGPLGFASS